MDLSNNELDLYLRRIFTSAHVEEIRGKELLFKNPSNLIRIKASNLYYKSYKRACDEGVLPREEIEKLIDSRGIITDQDKITIDKLEAKLSAQKVLLSKTVKVKANQDRLIKIIKDLTSEINQIKYKRTSKLMLSAEVKAEEERYDYYCRSCTYMCDSGKLYWETYKDFINDLDLDFKQDVLNCFVGFFNGIPTNIIRYIARSNLWRIRYITSLKTSETLFGIATSDYSDDMLNLVFWSNYYQNIYEMMPDDRPSDSIIEDDDALDAYMNSFYEEKEKESKVRNYKKNKGSSTLSAFDQEEVIVTRFNELYEDIKYDTPRESQRVKDRTSLKKRTKRSR